MRLQQIDFLVASNDIYIIPTFRIFINNMIYVNRNFSIEFHWIVFHMRLLFMESEDNYGTSI